MEPVKQGDEWMRLHFEHYRGLSRMTGEIVSAGEDGVLLCLLNAGRSMLSGEIVSRMGLTTGRVANILKHMEACGMILRAQDREDKRRVHVSLTDSGRERAEEALRELADSHRALLDHLGARDAGELLRLLRRCASYYETK